MSIFKRKTTVNNVLSENYVPAILPSEGYRLENFVASDYPMNKLKNVELAYKSATARLNGVLLSCDIYSFGSECDYIIDYFAQKFHIESANL